MRFQQILAAKGHEGNGVQEFCRPSGICCDDEGRVIVADSKNQRVLIFSPVLEFLWAVSKQYLNLNFRNEFSEHSVIPTTILICCKYYSILRSVSILSVGLCK